MRFAVLLIVFSSVAWAFTGCELLTTREPETPVGSGGSGWLFPSVPRMVMDNLENAVGRRSAVDYMRCFSSDDVGLPPMQFLPDPDTDASNPGLFDSWGCPQESAHVQSLFSSPNLPLDSLSELKLFAEPGSVIGDSAYITARYELHVGHLRDTAPRRMEGRLEFRMLRAGDGGWYVNRWKDYRTSGLPCWSDLKARF